MSAIATGHIRGHELGPYSWDGERWLDHEGRPVDPNMPCAKCSHPPTAEGYDACIGYIPGAVQACCGHGVSDGYALYELGGAVHQLPVVRPALVAELARHEQYMWGWDAWRCRCNEILSETTTPDHAQIIQQWAAHVAEAIEFWLAPSRSSGGAA